MKQWILTSLLCPDNDRIVETQDSGGCIRHLRFYRNLWWFSDMSMYVYFTPIAWREV